MRSRCSVGMWAMASSVLRRLWSLPMRRPPVKSYIHMAEPRARAKRRFISPSLVKMGMRKGSTWTRCGAVLRRIWRSRRAW